MNAQDLDKLRKDFDKEKAQCTRNGLQEIKKKMEDIEKNINCHTPHDTRIKFNAIKSDIAQLEKKRGLDHNPADCCR